MPLFGRKNDGDKKEKGKDGDIRKKYDFKETLGT